MPAITLDFQNSQQLDPRVTFSRSSCATYINSAGLVVSAADHEPRFDHDPVTGECLGLLVEESRTNLEPDSEELDTWGATECSVTPNVTIAPDGTATADRFVPNVGTVRPWITSTFLGADAVDYTFSIYAKADVYGFLQLASSSGFNSRVATFDLVNGLITYFSTSSATIEPLKDGWYRCSITQVSVSNTNKNVLVLGAPSDPGSNRLPTYTAAAGDGLFLWGAQGEQGSFPTSYIPTTGSTVTRSADIAQITGDNFSSWYNQSEGTVFENVSLLNSNDNSSGFFTFISSDGSRWQAYVGTGPTRFRSQLSAPGNPGGGRTILDSSSVNVINKFAVTQSGTSLDFALVNNEQSAVSGTYHQPGTFTGIEITNANNKNTGGTVNNNYQTQLNGHIARLSYYNERLTDAELQTLTS